MRLTPFVLAVVLYGQNAVIDPSAVLDGAREKIRDTMKRLPKYTCVETIDRTFYRPSGSAVGAQSCDQLSADRRRGRKPLRVDSTDRLRLEVAQGMDDEIHSWPGAGSFDFTGAGGIVDNGAFGTGDFGALLASIFDDEDTQFDYRGEQTQGGKRTMVFGYTVPVEVSRYEVHANGNDLTTGYGGIFEVDPETEEIQRLMIETAELPLSTGLCEADTTYDYRRVAIGDGSFLLPGRSELRVIGRDRQENVNATVFSGCREFHGEVAVRFDTPAVPPAAPRQPAQQRPPLPPGVGVDLRLTIAIDTDTSAAGDRILATVEHTVYAYRSDDVLLPAGALAHERVSRIEHHFYPYPYVVIAISFQSIEINSQTLPFRARPESRGGGIAFTPGSGSAAAREPTMLPETMMPQVRIPIGPPGSFVFAYSKRHVIAAGTVGRWDTIYPPRPNDR